MLASHGLLHVPTGQRVAYAAIHFWLLLTQLMSAATVSSSRASASSEQPPLQAPPPPPLLMDTALTNCGDEDNTRWRPVCATANGVDYVLFGSECLLRQANRERHYADAGDATPVFREIALGFCRPSCGLIICEGNEQAICARNVNSGEVRRFGGLCDVARDVCVNDNDWQLITENTCVQLLKSPTPILPDPTTEATPLKASKGKSFTKIEKVKHGQDVREGNMGKSIPCPKVFNPVCAELFGVKATFINECLVNAENVRFNKEWKIYSEGVCAEDYASSETHKNAISKRSTVGSATVTFQLNAPEQQLNSEVIWTPNIENTNYMNEDVFSSHGGQMRSMLQYNQPFGARHSEQSSLDATPHNIRILPAVNDRVSVCKFGAGPVCGSSSQNSLHKFENICELLLRNIILNESWVVVNEGKCRRCVLNCTTDYDPICISRNGVNYTIINQCHLDHAICRNNLNIWKILGKGECKNVLKNISSSQDKYIKITPLNQNEEYFPRHTRKILEFLSEKGDESQKNESPPVVADQTPSLEVFSVESHTSSESLIRNTTSQPSENTTLETHIMNLWRSSKRKSPSSRRKRNW
ncbi:ovoinhibitor [Bactrocera neohumeralis]|uniref:ovoinhibitor n=1 Tax=Bactrocera neohumeralis TaxID=98809 RepID=UPI002165701D|nr:ovoinhibitor [Bactrocera neohumeralis]